MHFLLKVDTQLTDGELVERFARAGIRLRSLSSYYQPSSRHDTHTLVINYSALSDEDITKLETALGR